MEDKIKALIEKYEGMASNFERCIALSLSAKEAEAWEFEKGLVELVISDLKQLLTTSQGNPERMV